jgi:hypothetical protein
LYEIKGFLEEGNKQPCGYPVMVILVIVHVGFLGEDEGRVLKAYN